jgi:hypothetical protein
VTRLVCPSWRRTRSTSRVAPVGKFYWLKATEARIPAYFAMMLSDGLTFEVLDRTILEPGSLDVTVFARENGQKYNLTVRDYKARALQPVR